MLATRENTEERVATSFKLILFFLSMAAGFSVGFSIATFVLEKMGSKDPMRDALLFGAVSAGFFAGVASYCLTNTQTDNPVTSSSTITTHHNNETTQLIP